MTYKPIHSGEGERGLKWGLLSGYQKRMIVMIPGLTEVNSVSVSSSIYIMLYIYIMI
jgi:hypothetical protein